MESIMGRNNWIVVVVVSAIVAATVAWGVHTATQSGGSSQYASDAYDRVFSSKTLNCGYIEYPPALMRDPHSGKITGIFAEAVETAAHNLGLTVVWKEEVQWGTMIEGLDTNKYDAICSSVWSNSARWARADFTIPLYYSGIDAYVRAGDHRFDNDIFSANRPDIHVATIDGDTSQIIAHQLFPQAATLSLPQLADYSQLLLTVKEGKSDITFAEPYYALLFAKNNPGSIENATPLKPLRVFGNAVMVRKGETRLRTTLDGALTELINDGTVDKLVNKYAGGSGAYYPVATPYRTR